MVSKAYRLPNRKKILVVHLAYPIVLIMLDKLAADLAGLIIIASPGLAQYAGASIFGPAPSDFGLLAGMTLFWRLQDCLGS